MTFTQERTGQERAHVVQAPSRDSGLWKTFITFGVLLALLLWFVTVRYGGPTDRPATSPDASDAEAAATIDPNASPSPGWTARSPRLAPASSAAVHDVTLEVTEIEAEVAPGVRQTVWTFGGTVPGPVLRGRVGDTFNVTLVNHGTMGHSIDFHASKVAWNGPMRTIQPGESLTYRFEAEHAGIFMYHCGTAPVIGHIANGMYGAVVIDPPALSAVPHEFVLVQSELYLGAQGKSGDVARMQSEQWDAVVFNGYWNQYKFAPIRVPQSERVRIWVLDAGPSENSSFHVIGTIFDTVFREGSYALLPAASRGGSQAIDLQPAQGGFVEFTFDEPGLYPFVTHKFASAGKGALGIFEAGEVDGTAAAGH